MLHDGCCQCRRRFLAKLKMSIRRSVKRVVSEEAQPRGAKAGLIREHFEIGKHYSFMVSQENFARPASWGWST